MPTLNHWVLLPRPSSCQGTDVSNFVLFGYFEDHPQPHKGPVITSCVLEIALDGKWARTRSRVYSLGKPGTHFMQLLEEQGLTLANVLKDGAEKL